MIANTYLDIYTGLFQWSMYETLVDTLNGTGLTYVPFIIAIFKTISDNWDESAMETIKELEVKIVTMLVVMMLCFAPFKPAGTAIASVKYEISSTDCYAPSENGSGNTTGTNYDAIMADSTTSNLTTPGANPNVHQPVMWALAQYLSSAITATAIAEAGCSANYEFMILRMARLKITDGDLEARTEDFYKTCFLKAVNEWETSPVAGFDRTLASPWDDIDWIGSRTFLRYGPLGRGHYYQHPDAFMESQQRYGFVRNPSLRKSDELRINNIVSANPYCSEVWLGADNAVGLRADLLDNFKNHNGIENSNAYNDFQNWGYKVFTNYLGISPVNREDLFLKLVLQANQWDISATNEINMANGIAVEEEDKSWWRDAIDGVLAFFAGTGAVGQLTEGLMYKFAMKTAGPMLLALAQMILIVASPFLMVINGFKASTFAQLALGYFSLEFVNAVWSIGYLFDQRLTAVYFANAEGLDAPISAMIVMAVGIGQIFILPVLWLMLMANVGGAAVRGLSGVAIGAGIAQAAAQRGMQNVNTVKSVATKAATAGKG